MNVKGLGMQSEMRILLFIGELSTGGAERQFLELAKALYRRGVPVAVMLNRPGGNLFSDLEQSGVPIFVLHMGGFISLPGYYIRALDAIKKFKPDIIYGFMGAGIKSTFMTLIKSDVKTVWGIRNALSENYFDSIDMRIASILDRWFSSMASALICNSRSGAEALVLRGFSRSQVRVVNNGTDTYKFSFDSSGRERFRNIWGVKESRLLIGLVGRLHPVKNHKIFIQMVKHLIAEGRNVVFVCVGSGDDDYVKSLHKYAEFLGVADKIIWAGHQEDAAAIFSALDILVSCSDTEAFPNVVLEAMSTGLPIVATDVGDCREIIGDRGWIVPAGDSDALAVAVRSAILELPRWDKQASRQRIIDNYGVGVMVDNTLHVFAEVMAG